MPIEALPQATVRAIGSTSVISDPCSVVKELVDNALDASASSISVELSLNTIDVIQVKDNGIGISADDHPGVCRHACTSKIQTVEDLKNIGGTSFGFRGEALASVAEMSGGVTVTTRTTSDVIGSCVKYSREGEVLQNQRTAHPVGTTVRVTDFLKHIPVRRQTVLKGTAKALTKMRKLLQSYAYAQPSCRFSLKFLKAKNENNNWMYVPSPEAAISDAATNIAGRDASSCCIMKDVSSNVNTQNENNLTSGTYRLTAFLPRPDMDLSKINHVGQFVSLDGRPLSSSRGISHDIVKLFKSYLRSAASKDGFSKIIVDPFLCLQLKCPQGAYDVNIEPGKDDVLFEDREIIVSLVESLFRDFYGLLPVDAKKSPSKDKSASSNRAGTATGFNVLMARKRTEIPPPDQPVTVRELPLSHSTRKPPSHPPSQTHAAISPMIDDTNDSQPEDVTADRSPADRNSRFTNPWAVTKMNTPLQTPGRYGRNTASRASISPDIQRLAPGRSRAGSVLRHSPQSPPDTPDVTHPGSLRAPSRSPVSSRRVPQSSGSPPLSKPPTGSNSKRAARERDKERYGNGALDTWFQRTTQISMGQTPLDQPTSIDDLVPTLSQLARQRFGAEDDVQTIDNEITEPSQNIPTGTSGDAGSPSSEDQESTINAHDTSMNSGRGYPVLEHWAASLKDGLNTGGSSGLEWAMDFERRKKEANQKHRSRPVPGKQTNEPSSQPQSSQASQRPHQNRFVAAKAALAADRPFATEVTSKPAIALHDPRAYLMRHESSKASQNRPLDESNNRRHHTSRLPFERIPDGHDLHDICLSIPTDLQSISESFKVATSLDSYINGGKDAEAFIDPEINALVPTWTQQLQSIIAGEYRGSGSQPCSDQADLDTVIAKHLKLHY
ncbi:unnamed protein product [Penicillium pancosmium]